MTIRSASIFASVAAVLAVAGFGGAPPAAALTMQECSVKFKAAQTGGTLKGMSWNEFRKAECGADAKPAAAAAATPAATGNVVFPKAIAPAFAKETPGKARMHTCLEQYKANEATKGNGGLKWVQKGGGYYSQCNRRLKGSA
jgi:hypothetical protein